MFCREVGTTIIRGISDKNKAEIPSKKRFFGEGVQMEQAGARTQGLRASAVCVCVWRPAEVEGGGYRECGAETTQGGDSAGRKRVSGIKSPQSTS